MKTITELNSKMWYRLVKVIYVLIFLIVLVISNYFIFSNDIKEIKRNETFITCTTQKNKKISLEDANIYLSVQDLKSYNYKNFFKYNPYSVQAIVGACRKGEVMTYEGHTITSSGVVSSNDVYRFQAMYDNKEKVDAVSISDWINYESSDWERFITYETHLFEISPSYSYKKFIYTFAGTNLSIIIIFLLLRTVFHYIVLGSTRPRK